VQHYFLVERIGGVFGTGQGEEYTDSDPNHPEQGIYIPMWMPITELSQHDNIYPADVAALVDKSTREGWPETPVVVEEPVK